MITIDGSYGEGGGQVLRTSLTLSALLSRPMRIERIRAGRRNPGLQAQHLTGVRATAQVCGAELEGAKLGSQTLTFVPQSPPRAGEYAFDVAEARKGGSAGATSLVLQTLLLPLAFASATSRLTLQGGTHVAWSPPFHYLEWVYLPTLARMGIEADVSIERWGWYPIGGGVMKASVKGRGNEGHGPEDRDLSLAPRSLLPLDLTQRGTLRRLHGLSALSNLPMHIAERQRKRAVEILRAEGFAPEIEVVNAPAKGRGTCVFLLAEYENGLAGFTALGARGKPAEKVAEEACRDFLAYHKSGACLDMHLADQLILPMALARGPSAFTTCRITQHLLTNIWVVEQFMDVRFEVEGKEGGRGRVTVHV
ncbi:MAG TPA: RNA 3'-phosphate cyclase [Anaerolineae bacterium]|nr:RNA 3'-phosphate cyclase [Anaerolineae bacterium]